MSWLTVNWLYMLIISIIHLQPKKIWETLEIKWNSQLVEEREWVRERERERKWHELRRKYLKYRENSHQICFIKKLTLNFVGDLEHSWLVEKYEKNKITREREKNAWKVRILFYYMRIDKYKYIHFNICNLNDKWNLCW